MKKFRVIEKFNSKLPSIKNPENKNIYSPLIKINSVTNNTIKKNKINNILFFIGKILGYLKFELNSAFTTEVSKKVFETRKEQCLKCPGLAKSPTDPIGYCKLCGCGMNPRARLTVKLTVAGATCPKKLWKPVRGKFSVKNFMKSLLGISQTVWYNLKQLCKSKKRN
jgi:hypothetical protein